MYSEASVHVCISVFTSVAGSVPLCVAYESENPVDRPASNNTQVYFFTFPSRSLPFLRCFLCAMDGYVTVFFDYLTISHIAVSPLCSTVNAMHELIIIEGIKDPMKGGACKPRYASYGSHCTCQKCFYVKCVVYCGKDPMSFIPRAHHARSSSLSRK